MLHRTPFLAVASLVLVGCTAADPSRSAVLRDSAGVRIAENPRDAAGEEWRLRLPAVLEIGGGVGEGDGPDLLGSVRQVLRLSSGNIAVADGLAREILIFGEDGVHLVTFGGQGEGPGEFANLLSIAELRGDSIAATDSDRVSLFTSAGEFARSFPIPRLPGASAPNVVGWFEDGTLLVRTLSRSPSRDTRDQSASILYSVGRRGEILNTLGEFADRRLGRNGLALGFGSRAEFAVGGRLAWHGHSGGFELTGFDRAGAVRRIVRLDRIPTAVTQKEIAEARAEVEEILRGLSGPAVQRIRETEFARVRPLHGAVRPAEDGGLWVERYRSPFAPDALPREWDIFDAEGRLAGRLTHPGNFEITDIGRHFVLGVHSDELGVPTARKYGVLRDRR